MHSVFLQSNASMAQVEMTHVPYKGAAPAMTDVMGGQIQIVAATVMSAMPLIQGGKLKALGVTSSKRSSALPNVPTVAESALPGFEATAWFHGRGAGEDAACGDHAHASGHRTFSAGAGRVCAAGKRRLGTGGLDARGGHGLFVCRGQTLGGRGEGGRAAEPNPCAGDKPRDDRNLRPLQRRAQRLLSEDAS